MSVCKQFGKDRLILVTAEDHQKPSSVQLAELDSRYEPKGLVLPNGEINWNCPCLGGMPAGPCGFFFRQAFGCFNKSSAQPKGSDCMTQFTQMQDCMTKYPNLYPQASDSGMAAAMATESPASPTSAPSTPAPSS
jgi:intermembrane space import and assembly protein 40